MKAILFSFVVVFCAVKASALEVGDSWPMVSIARMDKSVEPAQAWLGKLRLINFWATWCEACKTELVEMQELLLPLEASGLELMFVSLDKDPSKAKAWFQENLSKSEKMLKYLYIDPDFKLADQLKVDSFPFTVILDEKAKVLSIQRGFNPGAGLTQKLAEEVQKLLKKTEHRP